MKQIKRLGLIFFVLLMAILILLYLPYMVMALFTMIAILEYMLLNWIYKEVKKL
jgi:hypothetical protein